MKYDIIIIGGGIAGLYAAYNLCKKNKILIIERSSTLGGRVKTDHIQDYPIDLGAARFSNKHKKILSLLKKFKLTEKCVKLPTKIDHYYLNQNVKYNVSKYLKKLNSSKNKYTQDFLSKITLLQYAKRILGDKEADKLRMMFGYDAEFYKLNAYSALEMFDEDLFKDVTYYVLNGGLSQIIDKLEEYLLDNNVTISKDTNIVNITDSFIIDNNNHKYSFRKLITAIPKMDLKGLSIFKPLKILDSVSSIPLIRIYAKYPLDKNGKVWFHKINRTITDNFIRHIIPINYEEGIIMISYTDYHIAEMWNNLYLLGEEELTKKIESEINILFGITIPKPIEYNVYYWTEGVHMWKTNHQMDLLYQKILKPFKNKQIFICNESYSKHQCWMEGSLDMAKDVVKQINKQKNKKTIKKNKKNKKQIGGRKKTKNIKRVLRKYKIKEVLNNKRWIILEHGRKKNIYEISSYWFKNHPGGSGNLKKGIQANSFYNKKDPNKSDKSPIQLFKSIGVHSRSNVLKEYIMNLKYPKILKLVGLLK